MNATFYLSHLQAMGPLADLLHSDIGTMAAANVPSSVSTTHFAHDGTTVASKSETSYAGVTLDHGQIVGGSIQHSSIRPDGHAISGSSIALGTDGKPRSVSTQIANRFSAGIYKTLETDLGAVRWTPAMTVHSGSVKIRTLGAGAGAKRTEGSVQFDNESVQFGAFSHFADGKAHHHTEVDYRNCRMLGHRLIGGYCGIGFRDGNGALNAHSELHVSTLGHVTTIDTSNFDPKTGTVTSKVTSDFSGMNFDPLGRFHHGDATYTVADPDGTVTSKTTSSFAASVPAQTVTEHQRDGKTQLRIVTSYGGAQFNNDLRVISSDVMSSVYGAAATLLSKTTTTYDDDGNWRTKVTDRYHPRTGALVNTTTADYSAAQFDSRGRPVGGFVQTSKRDARSGRTTGRKRDIAVVVPVVGGYTPILPLQPGRSGALPTFKQTVTEGVGQAPGASWHRDELARGDGTLLQQTETTLRDGVPTGAVVTRYALDGKTVVTQQSLDMSGLSYDASSRKLSGAAQIRSLFAGSVPSDNSTLKY